MIPPSFSSSWFSFQILNSRWHLQTFLSLVTPILLHLDERCIGIDEVDDLALMFFDLTRIHFDNHRSNIKPIVGKIICQSSEKSKTSLFMFII